MRFVVGWWVGTVILERDPARVLLDIQRGNVTAEWATEVYGVIFDEQGQVDTKRTDIRRNTLRKARIHKAPKRVRWKMDSTHARHIAEGLFLVDGSFCVQQVYARDWSSSRELQAALRYDRTSTQDGQSASA